MRTTLTVDDDLMANLREIAHRRKLPLRLVVNQAIRAGLKAAEPRSRQRRYKCPTFRMGAPLPGVDLDKALALAGTLEDAEIMTKLALRK